MIHQYLKKMKFYYNLRAAPINVLWVNFHEKPPRFPKPWRFGYSGRLLMPDYFADRMPKV
jgi:hypothetical protein